MKILPVFVQLDIALFLGYLVVLLVWHLLRRLFQVRRAG